MNWNILFDIVSKLTDMTIGGVGWEVYTERKWCEEKEDIFDIVPKLTDMTIGGVGWEVYTESKWCEEKEDIFDIVPKLTDMTRRSRMGSVYRKEMMWREGGYIWYCS